MAHVRRIDIIDETYVRAAPAQVRAWLERPGTERAVWPPLHLEVVRDRGPKGLRWRVSGQVAGEMEVWIEPFWDGAIVHHYLRAEPARGAPADVAQRHRLRWKQAVHALKDALEATTTPTG